MFKYVLCSLLVSSILLTACSFGSDKAKPVAPIDVEQHTQNNPLNLDSDDSSF